MAPLYSVFVIIHTVLERPQSRPHWLLLI